MTKILLLVSVFFCSISSAQNVRPGLTKIDSNKNRNSVYFLKIFNNESKAIGIVSSVGFSKFSEFDTLQIAIGDWYNGDGKNYFYSIEKTIPESEISEDLPNKQIILLNPQTYFLTNINLTDLNNFSDKNIFFSLEYIPNINYDDIMLQAINKSKTPKLIINKDEIFKRALELTVPIFKAIN